MKAVLWGIVVAFCFFVEACGSTLEDNCAFLGTCSCDDPSWAGANPQWCPPDAGTNDAGVDGDQADHLDSAAGENTEMDQVPADEDGGPEIGMDADASLSSDTDAGIVVNDGEAGSIADAPSVEAQPDVAPCDGTAAPSESSCVIDEQFGVFVSPSGSDTAAGTRGAPLRTIGHALTIAKPTNRRVYACDNTNGNGYFETITIDTSVDGMSLFGGFACVIWTYSTTRHASVLSPTGPALVIRGTLRGVLIEDFAFQAPNGLVPGTSSIGGIIDSSTGVVLRRTAVFGGNAAAGADGTPGMAGQAGAPPSVQQNGMPATCAPDAGGAPQNGGFWQENSMCGSSGGGGGIGMRGTSGTTGSPGTPGGMDNSGARNTPGGAGATGGAGAIGIASSGGTFSNMAGYYTPPPVAGGGTDGTVGQGGGGGGGGDVPLGIPALSNCLGASGGAGGMGGCGGTAGTGGSSGGASVGLLVWMSSGLMLDTCNLESGNGGAGGKGGNGGNGGMGGPGGMGGSGRATDAGAPITPGGNGGMGGNGGPGGPGAGGNGGPSYALVYRGRLPSQSGGSLTPMAGGGAGMGGTAGLLMGQTGAAGLSASTFSIP